LIAWPAPSCNQPPRGGVLTGQEVTVTPQAGEEFLQSTLVHLDAVHALDPAAGARARRGPGPGDVAQGVRRLDRHAAPRPAGLAGDDLPQHRPIVVSPGRRQTRAAGQRPGCGPCRRRRPGCRRIGRVRAEAVHQALWTLPEVQRVAVTLMDLSGFTAQEVAGLTGAPRGTVLSRVHRGRKAPCRRPARTRP